MSTKQNVLDLYENAKQVECAFYKAFGDGDISLMESLYADEGVSYTHGGNPTIVGRDNVMNNWRVVLEGIPKVDIETCILSLTSFDKVEIHQVRESFVVDAISQKVSEVYSTNVFVLQNNGWRLQTQHASLSNVKKITPAYNYGEMLNVNIENFGLLN